MAWVLTHGPIPDDLLVLHSCDNPSCVRPDHLFLGTDAVNMRDKQRKGRATSGPRRRLKASLVAEIRRRYAEGGETYQSLGREFGVSRCHVADIIKGKAWKDRLGAEGRTE